MTLKLPHNKIVVAATQGIWLHDYEDETWEQLSDNDIFEYAGLLVMASTNNTSVQIDIDGNGSTDVSTTLNEGEGYVVDGNVERVMARLYDVHTPLPVAKPELTALARDLTPQDRPGDYAQAVMDLVPTFFTPRTPPHGICT